MGKTQATKVQVANKYDGINISFIISLDHFITGQDHNFDKIKMFINVVKQLESEA